MNDRSTDQWAVGPLTISRAVGYVVGLPSFILGTATFMLGFALARGAILNIACLLYATALTGIGWRVAAGRWRPARLAPALGLLVAVLAAAAALYWALRGVLWVFGAPPMVG
ncbi:hypothetical protein GCM10023144_17700 [Pigmentiphaga soli]|uniref:Uncharacterized protein n=1 Tax=Pigmentiphaga soli TaxID=1007095 RepID=A0ABP8GUW8_9BURK